MTELEIIAHKFRAAIEKAIDAGEQESFFRKFPRGQCGHTTDILIQYLLVLASAEVSPSKSVIFSQLESI